MASMINNKRQVFMVRTCDIKNHDEFIEAMLEERFSISRVKDKFGCLCYYGEREIDEDCE